MADSLIKKLEACAEAHRVWSRKVPGSGQITMVANLLDEAAKRIAELEAENKQLWKDHWDGEKMIDKLEARLDTVKDLPTMTRKEAALSHFDGFVALDLLCEALEQKE